MADRESGGRRIPVVYYLSRNRHLEHPHFIEVPLSSSDADADADAFFLRGDSLND
jgi:Protein SOSEKI 2, plant